jgi:cell wall-associated NlpC family hydrolase
MPLKRSQNWPRKLAQLIGSAREVPFQWGQFDCALFCCHWVRELTGVDPGAAYRGKYSTEAEAQAIFGADLGVFAASIVLPLGAVEVHPNFARRGDIVFVNNGTSYGALGVVSLDGRHASCVSSNGVVNVHMHRWKRAWQVG